jgi:hypothetical protein
MPAVPCPALPSLAVPYPTLPRLPCHDGAPHRKLRATGEPTAPIYAPSPAGSTVTLLRLRSCRMSSVALPGTSTIQPPGSHHARPSSRSIVQGP